MDARCIVVNRPGCAPVFDNRFLTKSKRENKEADEHFNVIISDSNSTVETDFEKRGSTNLDFLFCRQSSDRNLELII